MAQSRYQGRALDSPVGSGGLVAISVIAAILCGAIAATGQILFVVFLAGAIFSIFLIFQPVLLLQIATITTFVIAGTVKYFQPEFDRIWWLAYGMAALLYAPALMGLLSRRIKERVSGDSLTTVPLILVFCVIVASSVFSRPSAEQLIVSIKSLFLLGGIWALLAYVPIAAQTVKTWLKGLLAIGLVQWLPAVYQYLFVRQARLAAHLGVIEASDSVVGTFGGSQESGGMTAVLALYLVASIAVLIALRRHRITSRRLFLVVLAFLTIPLLLMEVKIVFVYLPVALIVLYRESILRRPLSFIGTSAIGTIVLIGLIGAYQFLHWSAKSMDLQRNVEERFMYSFEAKAGPQASRLGVMTRRETLEFWWDRHGTTNLLQTMLGHGMGSSKTGGLVTGDVARRYAPMHIDRLGLSSLLWDLGILGVLAVLGLLAGAFFKAGRLALNNSLESWQRGLASGLQAAVPLFALSIAYRNDIPYAAPMMFLLMTCFGLLAWLQRQAQKSIS